MENSANVNIETSPFIRDFFETLEKDSNYATLLEQPFGNPENQTNLYSYLNMGVIENTLRSLKAQSVPEVDTFMSNGLEWVNKTVAANENGLPEAEAKKLAHRYVNLLALLAGAPTIFFKIGALTMFSTAPATVITWFKD